MPALARAFARDRALASDAWSIGVALIGGVALLGWAQSAGARIEAPLGRRDLVALVLAVATPIAARGMLLGRPHRELAAAATLLGGGALLATRAPWPLLGFAVAALLGARALERGRELLAGLALVAIGLAVPGIERLATGADAEARMVRAAAATSWRGFVARPLLGWGPGTMAWNDAIFRAPTPGLTGNGLPPAVETPAPLRLLYETGTAGAIAWLLVVAALLRARWRDGGEATAGWAAAGALIAALVASLGGLASASALWAVMAALAAGAAMAEIAEIAESVPVAAPAPGRDLLTLLAGLAYVATAVFFLLPLALAQRDYERAAGAGEVETQRAAIESAARRDPAFPLYAARAAWLPGPPAAERAERAWRAAERGSAVAALWLRAGWLAFEAGNHRAVRLALERALRLDPFAAAPPFLVFVDSNEQSIDCAARALVAEPRLLAAVDWRRWPRARLKAVAVVARWPGIDEAWRREFVAQAAASAPVGEAGVDWVTRLDAGPSSAVSSRIFGRRPWPAELARIRLDRDAAAKVKLAPAWTLPATEPRAFPLTSCAPAR